MRDRLCAQATGRIMPNAMIRESTASRMGEGDTPPSPAVDGHSTTSLGKRGGGVGPLPQPPPQRWQSRGRGGGPRN